MEHLNLKPIEVKMILDATGATANGGSSITISSPNSASVGSAVTGYYGQLTLNEDGDYSYVANQSTANALDVGETVTEFVVPTFGFHW